MKPPKNPRGGTRPGAAAVRRLRRIRIFSPPVEQDVLVDSVEVPGYRRARTAAARAGEPHPMADDLRALGVPVYDGGRSELDGYTAPRG